MTSGEWRLIVSPAARRNLEQLPDKALFAVLDTLEAIAGSPRRLGKPLRFELADHFSARRGPYRVVYRLDERERTVLVVAIGHRSDVYRRR